MLIRKTTLVIFGLAIALGGAVYYFDWKRGNETKPETHKRAYSLQSSDVVALTLSHPTEAHDSPIHFERRNGAWQITAPIETGADQSTVDGIVDQIASAEISQTVSGTPDRLKAYGLDPPQESLELQLANGAKHTLLIGNKTFAGDSVYTIVDGGQSVSLLPELLSTSTGKTLDALRDRSVLHLDSAQVRSFAIKSAVGEVDAEKENDRWQITKPLDTRASRDAVDSLLQSVSAATMTSVASEKPDDLARYGLENPSVWFAATNDVGARSTLVFGKKDGDAYFARDLSRPMIFRVSEETYKKLALKFADLRDKKVVHADAADIQHIELRNASGAISLSRAKDSSDDWVFDAPLEQKGKPASGWKVLDPLGGLSAEDVIDRPSANLLAQIANPAVTVVLTDKSAKSVTLRLSKPSGDFVYAQASDGRVLYKLKKDVLASVGVKPSDLTP